MYYLTRLKKALTHPSFIFKYCMIAFGSWLPDELYIKWMFLFYKGKKLNLKNPKTFNEKIQFLKLYVNTPDDCTIMADKYEVREYITSKIGAEYLIPLIGVWNNFDEIDFSKLPDKFVLKTTHDSGGVFVCKDKSRINMKAVKDNFERRLNIDYYKIGREQQYKNVPHRIIAEKFMVDESGTDLKDYKFFCFNGEPKILKVDFEREIEHRANYYDLDWNLLPLGEKLCPPNPQKKIEKPSSLEKMVELSKKLANGRPFLRVDFYCINGIIYFGEITFHPDGGLGVLEPEKWDDKLGEWIDLSNYIKNNK